jgi:hypothetical protein
MAASKNLDGFCAMHKNVILLPRVYGTRRHSVDHHMKKAPVIGERGPE